MTETHHSSQPRQTYHHGHLHEVLVKKGLEMARSGGTEAVVLREATRRAGVSPNAAYRHFANREALLDEVGLAAADQIGVVMREAVAEAQPIDDESVAVSQLVAACRAYLDFALTEPGLFDVAYRISDTGLDALNVDRSKAPNLPDSVIQDVLSDREVTLSTGLTSGASSFFCGPCFTVLRRCRLLVPCVVRKLRSGLTGFSMSFVRPCAVR